MRQNKKSGAVFKKTRFAHLQETLIILFGEIRGRHYFNKAAQILENELKIIDDRGSKAISKHLRTAILPGYACYRGLMECGVYWEVAYAIVEEEMAASALRMGTISELLRGLPFSYPLFKLLIKPIIKQEYPKEGWAINWKEFSQDRIYFHITTCLYYEELSKRGALELSSAFCNADRVAYDLLAPRILFHRKWTLAAGNELCDFCFKNGKTMDKKAGN
ncbi:L-2-amino-thiazoline-4-carboxylic acid hydrolase [Acetobacterium sp.]|uniref:L-2-amino-thiazoline-4-carboxylic acid hydrolase n=1 Tax=Acetobacterium sp. TaxID=1872094 RepID=UPI0035935FBA